MARPFDTKSLQLSRDAVPSRAGQQCRLPMVHGRAECLRGWRDARRTRPASTGRRQPTWVNRDGRRAGDARRDWRLLRSDRVSRRRDARARTARSRPRVRRHLDGRSRTRRLLATDLRARLRNDAGLVADDGRVAYASDQSTAAEHLRQHGERRRRRDAAGHALLAIVSAGLVLRRPLRRVHAQWRVRRATTSGPTISSAAQDPASHVHLQRGLARGFHRTDTGSRTCRTKVSSARSTCDRSRQASVKVQISTSGAASRNGGATARSCSTSLPTTPSIGRRPHSRHPPRCVKAGAPFCRERGSEQVDPQPVRRVTRRPAIPHPVAHRSRSVADCRGVELAWPPETVVHR